MSSRVAVVITCDHPGCDEEYGRGLADTASEARGRARGDHWGERKIGRRWIDLCPDHKEDDRG